MNAICNARQLKFDSCADFDGVWYRANTPFGSYSYQRVNDEKIEVYSDFESDHNAPFVIVGNAIAAQLACNTDFTRRISESLEFSA